MTLAPTAENIPYHKLIVNEVPNMNDLVKVTPIDIAPSPCVLGYRFSNSSGDNAFGLKLETLEIERLNVFLVYPVTHIFRLGRGQFSFHSRRGSCIGIFNLWTEKNPPSQLLKMSDFKLTKVRQYRKQT
jgi:hypothetical protein